MGRSSPKKGSSETRRRADGALAKGGAAGREEREEGATGQGRGERGRERESEGRAELVCHFCKTRLKNVRFNMRLDHTVTSQLIFILDLL